RDRSLELTSRRLFAYLIRLISSRPSLQNELSSAAGSGQGCHRCSAAGSGQGCHRCSAAGSGQGCHRCSAAANTIQKSPPAVVLHSAFVQYGFFRRTFVVHFSSDVPCLISDPLEASVLATVVPLIQCFFGPDPFDD